ncbi:unnamed protein product [Auanema sp. JU1783]|nr:unnamed protein product [Auanema sp. JU1783]
MTTLDISGRLLGDGQYEELKQTKTPPASPIYAGLTELNNRRTVNTNGCECRSVLEEEAANAVIEFSFAVQSICISEMLPRTSQLLFLNINTLEKATYCIELTEKGWRIASNRADCMYGDFRQLNMHTQYFEQLYQLLDTISPKYRERFANALSEKLSAVTIEKESEEDAAPNA